MIVHEHSLTLITFSIFSLLFLGIVIFSWGKNLPGKGSWLLWAGVLFVLAALGFDTGLFLKEAFQTKIWMSGWIWPRGDSSAITVGVMQDPLSLAMVGSMAVIVAIVMMNQSRILKTQKPERVFAAIAISACGVAFSWVSLTPWLAFAGLILSLIGGFVAFGSCWDANVEAKVAARFILERASGFLLAFFGACILATSRTALLFGSSELWSVQGDSARSTWVGSTLLVVGAFIQMQPFPFLGWLVSKSEMYSPMRTLLNQVFPAWASFALLVRLEPEFVNMGLFPGFGWVALISTFFTLLSGLFQDQWKQGVGIWLAAGYSLSCALLAFSGPLAGMSLFLGVSLSALCLVHVAASLENVKEQNSVNKQRAVWVKVALFFGAASGSGVIGFISAVGGLRWMSEAVASGGAVTAAFLLIIFLFVLLCWKLTWKISKLNTVSDVSWVTVLSLFLYVVVSFGFFWTGSVTGVDLLGSADQFMESGFKIFFSAKANEMPHAEEFLSAAALLYSGALILAFVTAYWTAGRREDKWEVLARVFPRASKFLARGYGIDELSRRGILAISSMGSATEYLVDNKIWNQWIPYGLSVGVKGLTGRISTLDRKILSAIESVLRVSVHVPAKILQLIQTGDVRWYLFFGLGSGFALLSHFLKL